MDNIHIEEIAKKGARIYLEKEESLVKLYKGEFAAIHVQTSDYFLGETGSNAIEKAKEKYPNDVFYLVKIGYSATQQLSRMF